MKINQETISLYWLSEEDACFEGVEWFEANFGEGEHHVRDVLNELAEQNLPEYVSWLTWDTAFSLTDSDVKEAYVVMGFNDVKIYLLDDLYLQTVMCGMSLEERTEALKALSEFLLQAN